MMLYCVGKAAYRIASGVPQRETIEGEKGFDELRRYIKQGNVFCSDVAIVMQERSDVESGYAKSLSKISNKLTKAANSCIGTLAEAWALAASEMEAEAELHRQLAQHLNEDLTKPIKTLFDSQHKTRKPIELSVDKSYKIYCECRNDEIKCKKKSGDITKDREKLCDQFTSKTDSKGKALGDKDLQKVEKMMKKTEESLKKLDKDYHTICLKAEAARQEWEVSIFKANTALQNLEEERISQMQEFLNKYNSHLSVIGPKIVKSSEKLAETVMSIDTHSDVRKVIDHKGTGPNQPEQVLPDYYAEDLQNQMNKERRRQLLQNYLIQFQQDLERETKAKEGVEKMVEVYQNKPQYADAETLEETRHKLTSVNSNLNFLTAAFYKLSCSMAELESKPKPTHQLQQYIERTRDKQGYMVSILKLPSSMVENLGGVQAAYAPGRGHPDGVPDSPFVVGDSRKPSVKDIRRPSTKAATAPVPPKARQTKYLSCTSRESDEWVPDDDEFEVYDQVNSDPIGQCRAIYEYIAQQNDELSINPGDIINIFDKQVDGWWQGEVQGRMGIFPGSYVEEVQGATGYR